MALKFSAINLDLKTHRINAKSIFSSGIFGLLLYFSYFSSMKKFGFYEDDYNFIAEGFNQSLNEALTSTMNFFRGWVQGRPLSVALNHLAGYFSKSSSLIQLFIFAFCIQFANLLLLKEVLSKKGFTLGAIFGVLVLLFIPTDSTRILVHHSFLIHLSEFFILSAVLLLEKNKLFWGYFFSILALLTYETFFLIFILFPFVSLTGSTDRRKRWAQHLLICFALIGASLLIRYSIGETRVSVLSQSPISSLVTKVLTSPFIGFTTVVQHTLETPVKMLQLYISQNRLDFVILCFGLISIGIIGLIKSDKTSFFNLKLMPSKFTINQFVKNLFLVIGMIFIAYVHSPLSEGRFPPAQTSGRLSSTHSAAILGFSVLFCLFVELVYRNILAANQKKLAVLLGVLVSIFFSGLYLKAIDIQKDYAQSWKIQKSFWNNVATAMHGKEVKDGQRILVFDKGLIEVPSIQSFSWTIPLQLEKIFNFPKSLTVPPRVYILPKGFNNNLRISENRLFFNYSWLWFDKPENGTKEVPLDPCNVVLMEANEIGLVQISNDLFFPDKCDSILNVFDENNSLKWQNLNLTSLGKIMFMN
jgi:hypothetical protein